MIPRHKFASEKETQKETLNVLLLHEMTRIRNVRRNSKHFLTIKVDGPCLNAIASRVTLLQHVIVNANYVDGYVSMMQINQFQFQFLTNNVVLRTKRTMTVSRNAKNDFRTENERLAYGSLLTVM